MVVEVVTSGEYKLTNLGDHTSRVQNLLDHPNWTSYREQLFDWWLEGWIERLDGWSLAGWLSGWLSDWWSGWLSSWGNLTAYKEHLQYSVATWFSYLVPVVGSFGFWARNIDAVTWRECLLVPSSWNVREKIHVLCVKNKQLNTYVYIYIWKKMCQIKCTQYDKLYINTQIDCGKHSVYVDKYTC
jgi:hypothetical protein